MIVSHSKQKFLIKLFQGTSEKEVIKLISKCATFVKDNKIFLNNFYHN